MQNMNNQAVAATFEDLPTTLANLKRLAYFVAVFESGSFTAAADQLGISKAMVSQQVARLENDLKVTLFSRTTRKVSPTDAAVIFYQRCTVLLRQADDAFNELVQANGEPRGTLRLTAPADYGSAMVVPAIAEFIRRYPNCKVDAVFSDQSLDLVAGQAELAIRASRLTELHLQSRQIGSFKQILVAGAGFKDRVRTLLDPQEIIDWPFITITVLRTPRQWQFSAAHDDSIRHDVTMREVVAQFSGTIAVRQALLCDMGLSVLPEFIVADDLVQGRLVHVLPQWHLPIGGVHAVYPAARFRSAKVKAFVAVLIEQLKKHGK